MIRKTRTGLVLAVVAASGALIVVAACTSSDDSPTPPGVDASTGCAQGQCVDAPVGQSDAPGPTPDSGPITDAGVADVDPWGDADPNCTHYADTPGPGPVTVRIRNLKSTPVYLGSPVANCQYQLGFDLHDQGDASLTPALQQQNRCSDFQTNATCPTSTCYPQIVTKIGGDGGYHDIGWPATVFGARYMAKACYADAGCATGPCMQERPSPPGTISVTTYPSFYCDGGACFDCTNGGQVSCLVFGSVGGTSGTPGVVNVPYDGGTGLIQVVIGP